MKFFVKISQKSGHKYVFIKNLVFWLLNWFEFDEFDSILLNITNKWEVILLKHVIFKVPFRIFNKFLQKNIFFMIFFSKTKSKTKPLKKKSKVDKFSTFELLKFSIEKVSSLLSKPINLQAW